MAGLLEPPKPPMSDAAFVAKLHIFTREVSEGFFSEKVVLVEGETDKAVIEAAFRAANRDLSREGVSVINVVGKNNLSKPLYIFRRLGIPTFVVFDNDTGKPKGVEANRLLQRLNGVDNPVDYPDGVFPQFAAIAGNLEQYLLSCLGDKRDSFLDEIAEDWGLPRAAILKTPAAAAGLIRLGQGGGFEFPLFDELLHQIDNLS